jgi:hypothetical protein
MLGAAGHKSRSASSAVPAGPSISGRWVSTEFASEVLELSPLGGVKVTYRGEPFPFTDTYQYSGSILKFTLNMPQGVRIVENTVTALSQGEMTIFLPRLVGLREERRVTYWRIDPESYSPLRAQLLGKWAATGGSGNTMECSRDDTFSRTLNGATAVGIFRVVDRTLEYHVANQQAPVARLAIVSITDDEVVLRGPGIDLDARMVRVGR